MNFEVQGFLSAKNEFHHETKEIGNSSYIYYELPVINPGIAIGLNEPFRLEKTEFEDEIETDTHIRIGFSVKYALKQLTTISAEDQEEHSYPLTIAVMPVESEEELVRKVVQDVQEELRKQRASLSFPASYLTPLETTLYVGFAAPVRVYYKDGRSLYTVSFSEDRIGTVTVRNKPKTTLLFMYVLGLVTVTTAAVFGLAFLRRKLLRRGS